MQILELRCVVLRCNARGRHNVGCARASGACERPTRAHLRKVATVRPMLTHTGRSPLAARRSPLAARRPR